MNLSIRDLELIRDATENMGRMRNGTPISEELRVLHDRALAELKVATEASSGDLI